MRKFYSSNRKRFSFDFKFYLCSVILIVANLLFSSGAFGQITQVGSSTNTSSSNSSFTIPRPSGLAVNDVMIVNIIQTDNDDGSLTDATRLGWTKIDGRTVRSYRDDEWRVTLLYKVATSTDVATSNFSFGLDNSNDWVEGAIVAFRGVDVPSSGPFDVTPGIFNITDDNSITASSITTVTDNAAIIMFGAVSDNRTYSNWRISSGSQSLNAIYDLPNTSGPLDISIGAGWAIKSAAGNSGVGTADLNNVSGNDDIPNGAILIALRPLATPPTITSFTPSNGCAGTTSVVITGTNFMGTTSVTFGGTAASSFTVNSATTITAIPASGTTGTIKVTTPGGTATSAGTFTINPNGTISLSSGNANPTICINNSLPSAIIYTIGGGATGASLTAGSFPAGVTGSFSGSNFTISGTPTESGTFPFTISASGSSCSNPSLSGSIRVNADATISLSSGSDAQILCANSPLASIKYAIGGGATGASLSGALPGGVTGSFSGGVFTISGTPTTAGTYTYTVNTAGPCVKPSLGGTITVQPSGTISLASAAGTDNQTKCINTSISNITYAIGGDATGASITSGSLPNGVTGGFSGGSFSITGSPTESGVFNYTITTSGSSCSNASITGKITVNENGTVSLSSAAGTSAQSLCVGTPLTTITYNVGGLGTTGVNLTGALPGGVTGSYNSGTKVYTISGTPNAIGTFNYTLTTTGPCTNSSLSGSIVVNSNGTVSLTSGAGSAGQTLCINNPLTNITYAIGGDATGASITLGSLPGGVIGTFSAGVFTISGIPSTAGVYNYTLTASGSSCSNLGLSGSITVNDNATIILNSAAGTDAQTKCISTGITPITYSVGGSGTGVSVTGLPSGVSGNYNSGTKIYTISGTPSVAGTFNYTVTTTGPCVKPALSGTLIVQAKSTLSITSASGTDNQTRCINNSITDIRYTMGGGATGISLTSGSFPSGVTGSLTGNIFTISGTPTVSGSFPYTLTTSGPCNNVSLSGTITVNADATISLSSASGSATACINTGITAITYSIGGGGTGATVSGLPSGVSGSYSSGSKTYTISGNPSVSGTFNYTVTTSGPCVKPSLTGTITVTANATISLSSTSGTNIQELCANTAISNIRYAIGGSGTGASATSLPPGVTGNYSGGVYILSGSPTTPGTYNYTVTATGPCSSPVLTGTITVIDVPTGSLSSSETSNIHDDNIICAGSNVTFTAPSGYNSYTFYVNGTKMQGPLASNLFSSASLVNNDVVTVMVANGSNCGTLMGPITITVLAPPIPTLSASRTAICPGDEVTFTAGGGSHYTFFLNGNAIQSGTGNTYTSTDLVNSDKVTVIVTDAATCAATYPGGITMTVNPVPSGTLTSDPSKTATTASICAGNGITFTATAGFDSYEFLVNSSVAQAASGSNTFTTTTLTNPAVVTVKATNTSGCFATFNPISVTVNPLPNGSVATAENSGVTNDYNICSGANVKFTATSGFANYKFYLRGAGAPLQDGTSNVYQSTTLTTGDFVTVVVTNSNGCSSTFTSQTITVVASPSGSLSVTPSTTICAGDNVTFSADAGFTKYTFKKNGSVVLTGASSNWSSNSIANGDQITVDVTNANGCISTFNALTMTVNALPTGNLAITENSGLHDNDGIICTGATVLFTAPGGFANYNFLLNGVSIQNGSSATYTNSSLANGDKIRVAVTNGSGCIGLLNEWTITVNTIPTVAAITGTTTLCVNTTTTLQDATSGGTWSSSDDSKATVDATTGLLTGVAGGSAIITYTVTNANGCATSVNTTVTINPLPVVAPISGTLAVCVNSNTTLHDATPAGTWSSDNTGVATVDGSGVVTGVAEGNATITYSVTNSNGCTQIATVEVTVNPLPIVDAITGTFSICVNSTTTLANLTLGGVWTSSNTAIATINSSTGVVTGIAAGTTTISYTVTNGTGCVTTVTQDLVVNGLPVPVLNGPNPICPRSTGTYSTDLGQSNYTWTVVGDSIRTDGGTNDPSITITWSSSVNKSVYVNYTDANGCSAATSVTVATSTGTVPTLTGDQNICQNEVGTYTTQEGQTDYTWTATGGVITPGVSPFEHTATVNWNTAGTGTVSINFTDPDGCQSAAPTVLNVTVNPLPTVVTHDQQTCAPGTVDLTQGSVTTGSTAGLTYSYYSDAAGTTVLANPNAVSVSGIYYIKGTTTSSCSSDIVAVNVTINPLPELMIVDPAEVCAPSTIDLTAPDITTGSTTGLTFSYYTNAAGTTVLSNPSAVATSGTYYIKGTTPEGCSDIIKEVHVVINPLPTLQIVDPLAVCALATVDLTQSAVTAGSTAGLTYTYYTDAAGTNVLPNPETVSVSGTYYIKGTTTAGCADVIKAVQVTINPKPTLTITNPAAVCAPLTVDLTLSQVTAGSTAGLTYSYYSDAAGTNTLSSPNAVSVSGTYYIKGATPEGCSDAIKPVVVVVNPLPTLQITNPLAVCAPATVDLTQSSVTAGSTAGLTFTYYSDAAGTNTLSTPNAVSVSGTYYIKGTTTAGCSDVIKAVVVTINPLPTATISGGVDVCQSAPSPVITFTGAGSSSSYVFTYRINTGGNLQVISIGNTTTVSAPTGTVGTYTYTLISVQSVNTGCTQAQNGNTVVNVVAPPAPFVITPSNPDPICLGVVLPISASDGATGSGSMTFNSTDNNKSIPDDSNTGVSSTINVSGLPANAVITGVSVHFNVTHEYDGELIMNLKGQNGKVLNLVDERGGSGDDFNTTVSDDGTRSFTNQRDDAPFDNRVYRPDADNNVGASGNNSNVGAFSSLYGTDPSGNWTFSAKDNRGRVRVNRRDVYYTGQLNNWSITFTYTLVSTPNLVTWSPASGLFEDPGATIPYSGGSLSTVYAKPSSAGISTFTATQTNSAGCSTSQSVNVVVNPTPEVKITAEYCAIPGKVLLTASSVPAATSYFWSNGATSDTTSVDIAGHYDVTAFTGSGCPGRASINVASELVENGDFDGGNSGFITPPMGSDQYQYVADVVGNSELRPEGLYGIGTDGQSYHSNFWGHDHTTGTGNFMIINGFPNGNPQPIVWQETVNVLPNTTYYFSAWAMSLNNDGPFASLQFNVNGTQVGTIATLAAGVENNSNNGWTRFYGTLQTGPTTTTAIISITDLQNAVGGNDFGLDDVSFGTLSTFITLVSDPQTDAQSTCVNNPIQPIVYSVGSSATGPIITPALPAGLQGNFNGELYTITGTPTTPGLYTYTLTTTGSCLPTTATGTINVQTQSIMLNSGTPSPTLCVNTPVSIGYQLGGTATGAFATGLPDGVTLSAPVDGKVTISGSPILAGSYPYKVITTGSGCDPDTVSGTIKVLKQIITHNSGDSIQTVCVNTSIDNIQYTLSGPGTLSGTVTGLPSHVTYSFNSGILVITGTPDVAGSYTYYVHNSGNCAEVKDSGVINVTPAASISLTSANDPQTVCMGSPLVEMSYSISNATDASVSGLPDGVTGTFSGNVLAINGTPTESGTFEYTITTSGGCGVATQTGTIIVQAQIITLTTGAVSPTLCVNSIMTDIVYTISGTATGASVTGLPDGVTGDLVGSVFTIHGTPSVSGTFTYTINLTGTCATASATGVITVNPSAIGGTLTSLSICSGGSGTLTLLDQSGTIDHWEYSTDYGTTWTTVVNATVSLTSPSLISGRMYRVAVSNGCGIVYSSSATIGIHNLWIGVTSTDWNDPTNWSDGNLPSTSCSEVYIPGSTPHQPTLGTGTATIINLHILSGAILTIHSADLQVAGSVENLGELNAALGTVEFNGTGLQSIGGSTFKNNALGNLIVSNSNSAGLNITDSLDVYQSVTFGPAGKQLNTGDHLTLKSTKDTTASLGNMTGHTLSGKVSVERYINVGTVAGVFHGKSWQLVSTPTQGQSVMQSWMENGSKAPTGYGTQITGQGGVAAGFDIYSSTPALKYYDYGSNSWIGIANTSLPLYNPNGYLVFIRGDRSVSFPAVNNTTLRTKGTLFTGSTTPITIHAGKFESVGNPYASAIDLRSFDYSHGANNTIIVWDPTLTGVYGLGAYQTLLLDGDHYINLLASAAYGPFGTPNDYIQSGQAFFVQAEADATIHFTEDMKAGGSKSLLRTDGRSEATEATGQLRANLYIVSGGKDAQADGNLIQYGEDYSNKVDNSDARKMGNLNENFGILEGGKNLVIERRKDIKENDTIFYKLSGVSNQGYKFQFNASGLSGYGLQGMIVDNYLNTRKELNMEGNTELSFAVTSDAASKATNRFSIVFKKAPPTVKPVVFISLSAVENNADIVVEWKVQNENTMRQYEVETSVDGVNFSQSAILVASNRGVDSYQWIDKQVAAGYHYYRIRTVDQSGKIAYSRVEKVQVVRAKPSMAIYPNPITDGVIHLQLANQPQGMYKIRLLNPLGQTIVSKQVSHGGGNGTQNIQWDYNLAHGIYQLEVTKPDGTLQVIKVMY